MLDFFAGDQKPCSRGLWVPGSEFGVWFLLLYSQKGWVTAWLDPCTLPACGSFLTGTTGGDWCFLATPCPKPSLAEAWCQIILWKFCTTAAGWGWAGRKPRRVPLQQGLRSPWWTPLALCSLQGRSTLTTWSSLGQNGLNKICLTARVEMRWV